MRTTTNISRKRKGYVHPVIRNDIKFIGWKFAGKLYKTKLGLNIAMKMNKTRSRVATPIYKVIKK